MNWKKRLLALAVALVMVMQWIPLRPANAAVNFDRSASSGGTLGLAYQNGIKQETGFVNGNNGLTKFERPELRPFSDNNIASVFAPEELVTFIVALDAVPLLERFSTDEIAQQTEAVVQHQLQLAEKIAAAQTAVQAAFGAEEGFALGFTYDIATVGFSVTTAFSNMAALSALPGIKSVYVAPTYSVPESNKEQLEALTNNATTMIGSNTLNALGYTGKGMRIAILDTGITVDHPSFQALPDEALVDPMTRDSVDKIWQELNAGKMATVLNLSYYNSKIPFVFNYVSGDFNVANTFAGSDHGTHVAGIAAANYVEGSGVIGVAPDAQLVVMQVFQQGGGASFATIMAAMEDCVLLEVDSVNLSLGMAAGFCDPEGQMLETMKLFQDSDIQLLIASGNDTNNAFMNLWGYDMSIITNPDIGLAGTPSTYSAALAVASVDNDGYEMYYITVDGKHYGFQDTATAEQTVFLNQFRDIEVEYVVIPNFGAPEDYAGVDVAGKIALVTRGELSFMEKQQYAQEAGAVGIIVYNNTVGPFAMQITDGGIPAISIEMEAGAAMIAFAGEDGVGTLKVCNADTKVFKVPQTVSSFSSWGVTPDLKLKPEIAGVGGSIYSAVDPEISGTYYGYMSGTSMACPQVTGAMAVLIQYLDENYPAIQGAAQRQMAANILMSTANPILYGDGLEYTPRSQGAGLADLVKATTTKAYLSNPAASEGRPKVEFGDDPERAGVYTFSFTITNISDETVSYTFDSSVLSETIQLGVLIGNAPYGLEAKVQMPELVEVPAGETVTVEAKLELTENDKAYLEQFPNGIWVEGYIYANPVAEDGVALAMPMVGFYGDWSDAPIFDNPYDLGDYSLYPNVAFTYYSQMGYNPYFRNGKSGPEYSYFSYKNPIDEIDIGMLRNAKYMYISVVDAETGDLYYEIEGVDLAKTYYNANYGMIIPFYLLSSYGEVWDGTDLQGNKLPDGTSVYYVFDAWLDDGDDIQDDQWYFQATVDNVNPELVNDADLQSAMRVEEDRTYLKLQIMENERIAAVIFMSADGTIMGKYEVDNVPGELFEQEFDITGFGGEFSIIVADYACNETEVEVYLNLGEQNNAVPQPQKLDPERLYGSETYDSAYVEGGWFSASKYDFSDPRNETFDSANRYYSAEFVNGYVIAQSATTGHLELITPSGSYWSRQTIAENRGVIGDPGVWVLYDMALDHSGTLAASFGVGWESSATDSLFAVGWQYEGDQNNDGRDDGYNALFHIEFTDYGYVNVRPVARLMGAGHGADILTLGITTDGRIYGIDTNAILYSIGNTTEWDDTVGQWGDNVIRCTEIGVTDFVNYPNYGGANVIQSMGYDHNTGIMYWYAHSQVPSGYQWANINVTYAVDLETGACYEVGTYGAGGQTALFVPNDLVSDLFTMGVKPTGFEVDPYQKTLVEGQTDRLKIKWTPWNAAPVDVTWASADESIAIVDEYGFVTALAEGTVTIYATATIELEPYWDYDENWNWVQFPGGPTEITRSCQVNVVASQGELYGFIIEDYNNAQNNMSWVTFSDKALREVTNLGQQMITVQDQDGNPVETQAMWYGGTYYNGYLYTVIQEQFVENNTIYSGTALYRSLVTKGATAAETVIGEPERIGFQEGMVISAMAFDYTSGRMYCVENQNYGGLGIIDLETGLVDMLGWPNGDLYGGVYIPAICVTRAGTIVISDAVGSLYTMDPDTLTTKRIFSGNASPYTAFYEALMYDYNNDVIYYNMCDGNGASPLYMVLLEESEWGTYADAIELGGVSAKGGVQLTVMFTIPDEEPETQFIPVEDIKITNGDSVIGLEGGQLQLNAVTTPARPTLQKKTWTSSDESVVTVDQNGVITYVGAGKATVTVSITNKDEAAHGGPFTDTIEIEVLEAAGEFVAFLNSDSEGSGYYDFWIQGSDFDLRHMAPTHSAISIYSLRVGTYYDGYFYGYNDKGQFLRIDAEDPSNYKTLGTANIDYYYNQVTAMAMDYTTGTMYGLTLVSNYDASWGQAEEKIGLLVTIDLDTGKLTKVAELDFNTPVYALACDKDGQLYAAGGSFDMFATNSMLYKLDKTTGELTEYLAIEGAGVHTGSNYYGYPKYNTQLTYDFGTNRLYMNATVDNQAYSDSFGVFMIQLGEEPTYASLGGISLWNPSWQSIRQGDVWLALMCFIPDAEEIPVGKVNGIILNKTAARIGIGESTQLIGQIRPTNAADQSIIWTTSDPAVAIVDENGLVTGVGEGTAIITATSNETGVTATCVIGVNSISGAQNIAYTVSADASALLAFNPAMPSQTVDVIAKMDGGTTIKGIAYGDNCLYFVAFDANAFATYLYKFDFATKQLTFMAQLYVYSDPSGLAYDTENNIFYVTSGFYLFQFDGNSLIPDFNYFTNVVQDVNNCTLAGVAIVDGAIYTVGTDFYDSIPMLMKYSDKYLSDHTVVLENLGIPVVAGASDFAYDPGSGLFYITDPGHNIYSLDLEGNVENVDMLGEGLDINGLAIDSTAKFKITYTDGMDDVALFDDQVYFAAEGEKTPLSIGTPEREGYTFAGWSPAVADAVSGDAVYVATWTPNVYTLTFDLNGGDLDAKTMEVTFGQAMTDLPVPTRTGYTFAGWMDRVGNVYTNETVYNVADDLFLIALWTPNTYTITLDGNGGEVAPETIGAIFDAMIGELPEPIRPGYTFVGWMDENGNRVLGDTIYSYAGNITLTAQWSVNAYMIYLDPNGGELDVKGVLVEFGGKVNTLPVPTMVGYTFLGWFDAEGNEYTAETVYSVAGEVTLYAKWTESQDVPPTGDMAPIGMLLAMAAMAVCGMAVVTIKRKENF